MSCVGDYMLSKGGERELIYVHTGVYLQNHTYQNKANPHQ